MKTSIIKTFLVAGISFATVALYAETPSRELTALEKFHQIDTDGNGAISPAEFEAHLAAKAEIHNRSATTNQSGARTDNKNLRTSSSTGAVNDGTTNTDTTAEKKGISAESAVTPPQK